MFRNMSPNTIATITPPLIPSPIVFGMKSGLSAPNVAAQNDGGFENPAQIPLNTASDSSCPL
jgi:hypothetical protein